MKTQKYLQIFIIYVLLLSACRGNEVINESELSGVKWVLTTYNDAQPVTDHTPTLQFDVDQVSGTTGCNNYGGMFQIEGNSIQFEGIFSTEMACLEPDGLMHQEQVYLELLGTVDQFELSNGELTLYAKSIPILIFEAQTEPPQSAEPVSADLSPTPTAASPQFMNRPVKPTCFSGGI